jgi:hypothetical protein
LCLRSAGRREFARWVARLRKYAPLSKPIRAELRNPGDDLVGEVLDQGDHYALAVSPLLDYCHACETLIHEWAHIVYYERFSDRFDLHDDGYWLRFGVLYRHFYPDPDE